MKKILFFGGGLLVVLLFGTAGYALIENYSLLDALFMTVITITTVGYEEIMPLSPAGKGFTIILIFVGVGLVFYLFGMVMEAMVEGGLRSMFGRRTMDKKLAGLKNHFIVCGHGRIGEVICKILHKNKRPFLVIENDPKQLQIIQQQGYLFLDGDASDDETLLKAGIMRAKGLIAVISSDASNVYATLSARGLNPDLFIMARSSAEEGAETKLLRAGASKVISPYFIGATRMAQLIVRPTVVDFIDLTVHAGELGLRLEELSVKKETSFANKRLQDSGLRKEYDLIVVAIKRKEGKMLFNPTPQTEILAGDTLVVLGEHDNISKLEKEL